MSEPKEPFLSEASLKIFLDSWKAVNLDERRTEIDKQALEMYEYEQQSVKSRQELASMLKGIKTLNVEERNKKLASSIKMFQTEVDSLTKRAKFAEKSFHALYSCLYEAPDPFPALQNAAFYHDRVRRLEFELKNAKSQSEQYESELSKLKNQDVALRRLEEEKKLTQIEHGQACKQITVELTSKFSTQREELVAIFKEREKELLEQIQSKTEAHDKAIQSFERVQSQLFTLKDDKADTQAAKDSELDMLLEDLEKSRTDAATLRRTNDILQKECNLLKSRIVSVDVESVDRAHALEHKLQTAEGVIEKMKQTIEQLEISHEQTTLKLSVDVDRYQSSLDESMERIYELEQKIKALPVPEEVQSLKRKIHALQAVHFNAVDEFESTEDHSELEAVLLQKNKRLESEITHLKLKVSENEMTIEKLEVAVEEVNSALEKSKRLVQSLERDLASSMASGGIYSSTIQTPVTEAEQSRLEIVAGQRDRYRNRVQLLERQVGDLEESITSLQGQQRKLEKDNLKLYERLKYAQQFRDSSRNVSSQVDLESGSDTTVRKYASLYDNRNNPFSTFKQKHESQSLSTLEQITLTTARVCLGSRQFRTILFFYAFSLHILVFLTLWFHTVSSHC